MVVAKSVVRRKIPVTAIDSEKMINVLRRLDLYDTIINGEARCFICGRSLSLDNIGGILSVKGEVVLVCNKPGCIVKAAFLSEERYRYCAGE